MRHQLLITLLFCLLMPVTVFSQILSPVEWDIKLEKKNNTEGVVVFEATIEKGWHLYSTKSQEGGPIPTSVKWVELKNIELIGELTSDKTAHKEKDLNFDMIVEWWTDNVVLRQNFEFTNPDDYDISGEIKFMACNDQTCLSPQNKDFRFVNNAAPVLKEEIESDSLVTAFPVIDNASDNNGQINKYDFWKPVEFNGSQEVVSQKSFWYIFIGGFVGGLLALLTPCVWPMIPLTVSFFLKKHGDKRKSVRDAIIYGLSIVIIYLIVGIAITLAFGPNKLNELSTNAVFNIIFFLLLVIFAMSFFGAFEITLPSKWTNKMDATAERTTGLVSIFFMAFTLILVSFSCTGPIIGCRNGRFCISTGNSVHFVCHFSFLAEGTAKIRRMDEFCKSCIGIYRACVVFKIPFCCRIAVPIVAQNPPSRKGEIPGSCSPGGGHILLCRKRRMPK